MTGTTRPLSPHLQIYRLPFTAVLSITHRITGVLLALGLVLLTWVLASAAGGEDAYALAHRLVTSWLLQLLLFLWTLALYFHLCNGIRHLFWDAGVGYELDTANRTGWIVLGVAAVLTALTWIIAWQAGAGT